MVKNKLKNLFLFYSVLLLCSANNTFAVASSHPTATGTIAVSENVAVTCSVIASKQLRVSQEKCMEFIKAW